MVNSIPISVLGAGSWGTALAILIARNGYNTTLWGHNPKHITELEKNRINERYLPGIKFPSNLHLSANLSESVASRDLVLIAVPSHAFRSVLSSIQPQVVSKIRIAWATKGLDNKTGQPLDKTVTEIFSKNTSIAVVSGPTFAKEVAKNLPTAITVASPTIDFSDDLVRILHNNRFRVYTSNDIVGVQLGGAVKNVLAIATGAADGLGFGANTRAALVTRGLAEMIRLGVALGGRQETFMGLTGLGDLVLTSTDNQSRNRRLGLGLGQGKSVQTLIAEIGQEVEGIAAAREVHLLAKSLGVEMPITEQVYKVLYENLVPTEAVNNLLTREQKAEAPI